MSFNKMKPSRFGGQKVTSAGWRSYMALKLQGNVLTGKVRDRYRREHTIFSPRSFLRAASGSWHSVWCWKRNHAVSSKIKYHERQIVPILKAWHLERHTHRFSIHIHVRGKWHNASPTHSCSRSGSVVDGMWVPICTKVVQPRQGLVSRWNLTQSLRWMLRMKSY